MNHLHTSPGHGRRAEVLPPFSGRCLELAEIPAHQMIYRLARFFRQYLHCTAEQLAVLSLWTVHTHCSSAARTTPYLNICSTEKQSGKSLCLDLLNLVCAHPWHAAGVGTGVLTRKIISTRPTVLLDECQNTFGASDAGVRGLLVTGCKRGGVYEVAASAADVFCPKAFAGMRILPPAVHDRAVPITLHAVRPDETMRRFVLEQAREEAAPLVVWLKRWSADHLEQLNRAAPCQRAALPAQLTARQQDCVEPLLHIAGLIGGQVPREAQDAFVRIFQHDSSQGCFVQFVSDVRAAFIETRSARRLPTAAILNYLNSRKDRPWSTWHDGAPMNPVDLARLLRPHGITSRNIKVGTDFVLRGYYATDFSSLWQQYLPPQKVGNDAG